MNSENLWYRFAFPYLHESGEICVLSSGNVVSLNRLIVYIHEVYYFSTFMCFMAFMVKIFITRHIFIESMTLAHKFYFL